MAFEEKQLVSEEINKGIEYKNGDGLQPETINKIVSAILFLQKNGAGRKLYKHNVRSDIISGYVISTDPTPYTMLNPNLMGILSISLHSEIDDYFYFALSSSYAWIYGVNWDTGGTIKRAEFSFTDLSDTVTQL